MHAVHDKSHILRLRDGFQFRLPDLSLWNVGLGDFLEYSSGCVDIFSQIINREIEIDVLSFFSACFVVVPLAESSPIFLGSFNIP